MSKKSKRQEQRPLVVFNIKQGRLRTVWVRVGSATLREDGSMDITLDVLPMTGTLHVRPALEFTQD